MFLIVLVFVTTLLASDASAFFPTGALPTVETESFPERISRILNTIKDKAKDTLDRALKIAYKNSLRVFLGKLAEDTAIWISTAGTGQKPLFLDDPGKYFGDLGNAAAGDFADTLSTQFLGISLCRPDIEGLIQLEVGLRGLLNPATFCQDQCRSTYTNKVGQIDETGPPAPAQFELNKNNRIDDQFEVGFYEREMQRLRGLSTGNQSQEAPLRCYVDLSQFFNQTGPPAPTDYIIDPATEEYESLTPTACLQLYQFHVNQFKQDAQRELNRCNQACTYGKRTARCTLDQIGENLQNLSSEDFSRAVTVYFDPGQNQIGQLLKLYAEAQSQAQFAEQRERDIYQFGNIGPIRSKITGRILSPADLTQARARLPIEKSTVAEETFTGITEDVLRGAAGVFTNTLVGRLIERFFNDKCALNPDACAGPSGSRSRLGSLLFQSPTGIAAARLQFASLAKINYIVGDPSRNEVLVTDELVSRGILDNRFKQAVDEGLSVQEAIDKGLLDPNKTFGFTITGDEPQDGYPYTTLLYLRKFRIIPVGWELAAKFNLINPGGTENLTLEKLIEDYTQCAPQQQLACTNDPATGCQNDVDCNVTPTCNTDADCVAPFTTCRVGAGGVGRCQVSCASDTDCTGSGVGPTCAAGFCTSSANSCAAAPGSQAVPVSPYCGLVDPNWVLKAPQTYCQRQGAGEEIVHREFICDEDTNGDNVINCNSTDGQNADIGRWLIERRSDTCADERSCIAENEDGSCRAHGYCYEERPSWKFDGDRCDRQFVSCDSFTNPDGVQSAFLTNTLDHYNDTFCNGAAGCQWYCRQPAYDPDTASGTCTPTSAGDKIYLTRAVGGCGAGEAGCNEFVRQAAGPNLLRNGDFELLGSNDKLDDGVDDQLPGAAADSWLIHLPPDQPSSNEFQATSDAFLGDTAVQVRSHAAPGAHFATRFETGHPVNGRTFTFSFYAKTDSACSPSYGYGIQYWDTTGGVFGAFQTSSFTATDEWQRFSITSQVPETPTGDAIGRVEALIRNYNIGCTLTVDGAMLQEVAGVNSFVSYADAPKVYLNGNRVSCTADEVGCELYRPVKRGEAIPGVARSVDRCSQEAVGCQAWNELAIEHVPQRPQRDVTFINGSGRQCSAQHVGCEEYTNLNKVAQGGEAREYFTLIDQCVTLNNPGLAPFYTWEGDDVTGYQLRSHQALVAPDGSPCTLINPGTPTSEPSCAGTATTATCTQTELASDPDCVQYFDTQGNDFPRRKSMVIQGSASCNPYRNTIDEQNNVDTVYYVDGDGSVRCPSAAAGCREYRGSAGNNVRLIVSDTFEDGDTAGWTGGAISTEAVRAGGHSMRLSPGAFYDDVALELNHSYKVSVWAKGETGNEQLHAKLQSDGGADISYLGGVDLTNDWNIYSLGPGIASANVGGGERIVLTGNGGETLYVDNVLVQDVADTAFVIADSYTSCDARDVGCAAYTDRAGQRHFLKSFTRLCSDDVVGCEAVVNTQNSDNPFQQDFPQHGVTVPADAVERWVVDRAYFCQAEAQGCEAVGRPEVNTANIVQRWTTDFLLNEPDAYDTILCRPDQLHCEEWVSRDGATVTFRDPGNRTCQYGTFIKVEPSWTQSNTTFSCPIITPPPEGRPVGPACVRTCVAGDRIGAACVDDTDCPRGGPGSCQGDAAQVGKACGSNADCNAPNTCQYWAGLCPVEQAGCNEYRDPADPPGCLTQCAFVEDAGVPRTYDQSCQPLDKDDGGLPGCRGYYYLRQTVEDTAAECGSLIDPAIGCRSFLDTSNPNVNFKGTSQ